MVYAYPHFARALIRNDVFFEAGRPLGEPMPDFDLPTTDGGRARKSDFLGRRPLLLVCASVTCPMTASAGPALRRFHREFGDRVEFVTLYVREAHPGEVFPQPAAMDRKFDHARAYKLRDQIPWPVAVDDLDGTLHRALGAKPAAVYVMDLHGNVAGRVLWSNDSRGVRRALEAVAAEWRRPRVVEREARVVPLLKGVAMMTEVVGAAGREAEDDVRREAPPVFAMARMADALVPRSPLARRLMAGALALAPLALAVAGYRRLRKR